MKRKHRDLKVWQESVALVEMIYRATESFPKQEMFGLVSQMRRAAVSAPANIAEGAARNSSKELFQFLSIAAASISELDTLLELAHRLQYLDENVRDHLQAQVDTVSQFLVATKKSIQLKIRTQ